MRGPGIGAALAAVALLGVACGDSGGSGEAGAPTDSAATAPDAEGTAEGTAEGAQTVKVGFVAELSGPFQAFGIPAAEGMKLAVEQINEGGGFEVSGQRYELELLIEDDRSEEQEATAIANDFVRDQGVNFMFGAIGKLAPLVLQITNPEAALFFSPASAAAQYAGTPEGKYLFTTAPPLETRMTVAADALIDFYPDAETVVLLGAQVSDNQALFPLLSAALADKGLTVPDPVYYQPDTADFGGILTSIRQDAPDVVFLGSSTVPTIAAIIQQNKELQAAPAWFAWGIGCQNGIDAQVDVPFVADPLVGADLDNPQTDAASSFVKDYEDFTGGDAPPNLYAASWNYDFVFMLVEAMKEAGTVDDTDAISDALRSISHEGLVGGVTYNEDNEALYGFDICRVVDGSDIEVRHFGA